MVSLPKNHHYIPQSYQLLFSGDGEKVHLYDKKERKHIGPANPRNFCSENFLYAFRGNLGASTGNPMHIESPMLSTIDGRFVTSAKILMSDEKDKTGASLYHLASFFGFVACRQPAEIREDEINITNKLIDAILDNAKLNPNLVEKAKEMGLDIYDREAFRDVKNSEAYDLSLVGMIRKAQSVARTLHDDMGWLYLYSDKVEYVLNDRPLTTLQTGDLSDLGIEDAVYIPASKTLSIIFSPHISKSNSRYVTAEFVSEANKLIFNRADRWVIGSSKEVLESCIKS